MKFEGQFNAGKICGLGNFLLKLLPSFNIIYLLLRNFLFHRVDHFC